MVMKQKRTPPIKLDYHRDQLSQQLLTLFMQRNDCLLTSDEYERELDGIRFALPPWVMLNESGSLGGGTRFVVKHVATGDVLDEFEYPRYTGVERMSFK